MTNEKETMKRELYAAVMDLKHVLMSVGYDATLYGESICKYCKHNHEKFGECQQDCNSRMEAWEWRGAQNSGEEQEG